MCLDFTDLNKACPKDSYPLPRVDVLENSTARHQLLSFMDAFSGYNQIRMARGENERADPLAKAALAEHMVIPGNVLSFVQLSPLINPSNV